MNTIQLPPPDLDSVQSLTSAIANRRSYRDFQDESISMNQLAQLLWASQGITAQFKTSSGMIGLRTAPSAGALYPLEIYIVVRDVEDVPAGIYHYLPGPGINEHALEMVQPAYQVGLISAATLGQDCIKTAAVNIIFGAVISRTAEKYGDRAEQYVYIETGHAGQNLCLQAESLGLGAVTVGAFYDDKIKAVVGMEAKPVYIICVGNKK